MMETPPGAAAPELDLAEARRESEYLRRRKSARRRQTLAIALAILLGTFYVGWKLGAHFLAASWLEANHYRVDWNLDRETWRWGGATRVRYVERFDITQSDRRNIDLRFLPWLLHVEELDLAQATGLRDEHLIGLEQLQDLRLLDLDRTRKLAWLTNDQGRLTDATLDRVGKLVRLRDLTLSGQRITDAGLSKLSGLTELRSLDLRQTGVTDAGLPSLKELPGLRSLDLTGTNVTAEGIRDFEADRPEVKVVADPTPPLALPKP